MSETGPKGVDNWDLDVDGDGKVETAEVEAVLEIEKEAAKKANDAELFQKLIALGRELDSGDEKRIDDAKAEMERMGKEFAAQEQFDDELLSKEAAEELEKELERENAGKLEEAKEIAIEEAAAHVDQDDEIGEVPGGVKQKGPSFWDYAKSGAYGNAVLMLPVIRFGWKLFSGGVKRLDSLIRRFSDEKNLPGPLSIIDNVIEWVDKKTQELGESTTKKWSGEVDKGK